MARSTTRSITLAIGRNGGGSSSARMFLPRNIASSRGIVLTAIVARASTSAPHPNNRIGDVEIGAGGLPLLADWFASVCTRTPATIATVRTPSSVRSVGDASVPAAARRGTPVLRLPQPRRTRCTRLARSQPLPSPARSGDAEPASADKRKRQIGQA
jgi:hypothetical protein